MKKIYFILSFLTLTLMASAQDDIQPTKKQQDIEALRVAFISRELELTPEEAQKFWPLYNQYTRELNNTVRDDQDVLDRDEKVLNLRKRYKDQFVKVLGTERMNRLFGAEGRFRKVLIKAIQARRQNRLMNRPMMRRNAPMNR